ncbi:hypothetical protein [uncultured Clostridium sp.]|uniref:hypothetical protein n=1 Tax=uncultured Clostridium sp. TaxID=59620 RepID=UPI00263847E7|nr:hypothetical protein [uncultured Clostridium sp.]
MYDSITITYLGIIVFLLPPPSRQTVFNLMVMTSAVGGYPNVPVPTYYIYGRNYPSTFLACQLPSSISWI